MKRSLCTWYSLCLMMAVMGRTARMQFSGHVSNTSTTSNNTHPFHKSRRTFRALGTPMWCFVRPIAPQNSPETDNYSTGFDCRRSGLAGSSPAWPPRWPGLGPDPLSLSQHKTASQAHYRGTGCCLPRALPRMAVSGAEGRPAQHIIAVSDAIERSRHAQ